MYVDSGGAKERRVGASTSQLLPPYVSCKETPLPASQFWLYEYSTAHPHLHLVLPPCRASSSSSACAEIAEVVALEPIRDWLATGDFFHGAPAETETDGGGSTALGTGKLEARASLSSALSTTMLRSTALVVLALGAATSCFAHSHEHGSDEGDLWRESPHRRRLFPAASAADLLPAFQ